MPSSALGEFLGTLVLILLGNGVVAGVSLERSKANGAGWMVITAGWGFAVLCGVLVAVALGAPGELNPAVTLAVHLGGKYGPTEVLAHITMQMLGAMAGAALVWLHYLPHWELTKDPDAIRGCFCNTPAVRRTGANLVAEIIGTAVLVLVATAIGSSGVAGSTPASNLGPALVGALVWGIGLSLGGPTGYAINPARDLGPRVMHALLPIAGKGHSDWGYWWIPVAGPLVGGAVAAVLWRVIG